MKRTVNILLVTVIALNSINQCLSQNNEKLLKELDSIAFVSLEENSSLTTDHAYNLLKESEKQQAQLYKINAFTILGIVNKEKGYYVTALNLYLKALNVSESIKDQARLSACYNNIGQIYQLQQNFSKANYYYHLSLEIEDSLTNPLQKSIRLYNIGEVFNELDSLNLALSYFNNSLLIEKKEKNVDGIIYALLGISQVYIKSKRFSDAEYTLEEINSLLTSDLLEETIQFNMNYGKLKKLQGNNSGALRHYKKAEAMSINNEFRIHLPEIYELIIDILRIEQKWKECAIYYSFYTHLTQDLNDIKVKNQLEDMIFQNELTKKNLEIELVQEERDLAKKNSIMNKQISNYSSKITAFLIVSILLIVGIIVFGLNRLKKE
tara:strand:- start:2358 stop:3494 length:1137 start_codon:yes stop_codon:yes gene_type:complete